MNKAFKKYGKKPFYDTHYIWPDIARRLDELSLHYLKRTNAMLRKINEQSL